MKVKSLLLTVIVLAALAAALVWLRSNRGADNSAQDPRVGKPVVDTQSLQELAALTLSSGTQTVHLDKDDKGVWRVRESDAQPADFSRLARLATQLTEARVIRMVTESDQRMERLGLGQSRLSLTGIGSQSILDLNIGKAAADGGVYVRFGDAGPAYQLSTSIYVEAAAANWVDKTVIDLKPEDVASIAIPDDENGAILKFQREKPGGDWSCAQAPAGKEVNAERLERWLSTLGSLAFMHTAALDSDEVKEAAPYLQKFQITTFDGRAYTITAGQKPEQTLPPEPAPEPPATAAAEDDASPGAAQPPPQPRKIPAGPLVVEYALPAQETGWAAAVGNTAFVVANYYWSQKPKTADLFKDQPAAQPPVPPPPAPE